MLKTLPMTTPQLSQLPPLVSHIHDGTTSLTADSPNPLHVFLANLVLDWKNHDAVALLSALEMGCVQLWCCPVSREDNTGDRHSSELSVPFTWTSARGDS